MRLLKGFAMLTLITSIAVVEAKAQYVTRATRDSLVNVDTVLFTYPSTPDKVTGFSLVWQKAATGGGTAQGFAVLEQRIDTVLNTWAVVKTFNDSRDTAFITNLTQAVQHVWPIPVQAGNGYRQRIQTAGGSQKVYVYSAYLRRQL